MAAEGAGGELRCGWARAAQLGAWRLDTAEAGGWEIVHRGFVAVDEYWITQRPLTLRLHLGSVTWTWRDAELVAGSNVIRVRLAPEEGVVEVEQEQVRSA